LGKVATAEMQGEETAGNMQTAGATPGEDHAPDEMMEQIMIGPGTRGIDIGMIDRNPFQPRKTFDPGELKALSESLQQHGLLQPIVVRPVGERYQLIAGERRLRAAMKAGWKEVPVQVVHVDDRQVAELALTENLQRKDLNPIEKAIAFQQYLEEYGGTHVELAGRLDIDRSTVTNLLRLLELPDEIRRAVQDGKISQGHARALLPLGEAIEQLEFCERILQEGWSVRQTETMVQEILHDGEPSSPSWGVIGRDGQPKADNRSEHLESLEQEIRSVLGTKVKLTANPRGKGKLVVHFKNNEEFERIFQTLCRQDLVSRDAG
jgi:ParB family chromosome partitioning protein